MPAPGGPFSPETRPAGASGAPFRPRRAMGPIHRFYRATILGMERVCFLLQVKKGRLREYRRRHEQVWPEMLDALRETGWRNYSLFLRDDGLLVGYFETPDLAAALAGMESREVNARWQAEMAPFRGSGRETP